MATADVIDKKYTEVLEQIGELREGFDERHDDLVKEWKKLQKTLDGFDEKADGLVKEKVEKLTKSISDKQEGFERQSTERMDSLEATLKRLPAGGDRGDLDEKQVAIVRQWKTECLVVQERLNAEMRDKIELEVTSEDVEQYRNYRKAFVAYLRKEGDTKDLSVGSGPGGGFLVTPQMSAIITQIVRESSPVRMLAQVDTISSDSFEIIQDPNDFEAKWVHETGSRAKTTTADFEKKVITAFEHYANPQTTQKLLDDSAIDIEAHLARRLAERFARLEATAFVTGNGVGQPKGFMSYAAGTAWGQIEQVNSGAAADFTYDGLVDVLFSLKEGYAARSNWLINRLGVRNIMKLKDSQNNPLWVPSMREGQPSTLFGVPVRWATDVATPAANALAAAVGDFNAGYHVVDRIGVRTLRDPFTAKPNVLFYTTRRVGGDVENFEAIKIQKLST